MTNVLDILFIEIQNVNEIQNSTQESEWSFESRLLSHFLFVTNLNAFAGHKPKAPGGHPSAFCMHSKQRRLF